MDTDSTREDRRKSIKEDGSRKNELKETNEESREKERVHIVGVLWSRGDAVYRDPSLLV